MLPRISNQLQLQVTLKEMFDTVMDHSISKTRERIKRLLDSIPDVVGEERRKKQRLIDEEEYEACRLAGDEAEKKLSLAKIARSAVLNAPAAAAAAADTESDESDDE